MRPGTRLGIDVGRARIGVARCDPHALLATPIETVARVHATRDGDVTDSADVRRVLGLAEEMGAMECVVGLPLSLSGSHTASTADAEHFAVALASAVAARGIDMPIRLVDERLSTVSAQQQLRQAGRRGRGQRAVIDQAAAVVILQHALESERASGHPPGRILVVNRDGEPE